MNKPSANPFSTRYRDPEIIHLKAENKRLRLRLAAADIPRDEGEEPAEPNSPDPEGGDPDDPAPDDSAEQLAEKAERRRKKKLKESLVDDDESTDPPTDPADEASARGDHRYQTDAAYREQVDRWAALIVRSAALARGETTPAKSRAAAAYEHAVTQYEDDVVRTGRFRPSAQMIIAAGRVRRGEVLE
jgi:hypothetical protein